MRLKQAVLAIPFVIVMANQGKAEAVCTLPIAISDAQTASVDFCRQINATLISGFGDVTVERDGLTKSAMAGMPLGCGDKVMAGADGSADIEVDDPTTQGVDCPFNLVANSEFSLYAKDRAIVVDVETVPIPAVNPNPSPLGTAVIVTTVVGGGAAAIAFSNKKSLSNQ